METIKDKSFNYIGRKKLCVGQNFRPLAKISSPLSDQVLSDRYMLMVDFHLLCFSLERKGTEKNRYNIVYYVIILLHLPSLERYISVITLKGL